jgi:hypothetical protein
MDATPNLDLPFIAAAQAQKHVTHNEALRVLDTAVHLMVLDKDLNAPPGSPADGARYIVASSPTGAWSGHAGEIAVWQDGAWAFSTPREGWLAWVADEDTPYFWTGSAWTINVALWGINATPDPTNRFAISSAASLFNHAGNGHQLKVNKNAAADTASFLFQTGFSGRAEMGTAGNDDFQFKVSPDGSAWIVALQFDRTTGRGTVPSLSINNGASANSALIITGGGATNSCRVEMETSSDSTNPVFQWRDNSPGQARVGALNYVNSAGAVVGQLGYQFNATGASQWFRVFVNSAERMRWDGSGNCLLGGTASPASAQKALVLFNGTAPTGGVTDGVVLFAADVSASSELRVRDEAGNITTLSPHNFSGIPEGPSEPMAWAYRGERNGHVISVDMLRVVRLLEKLSGEKLVHETPSA